MNYAKFCELFEWTAKGYLLGRYTQTQFCDEIKDLADSYRELGDPGEKPQPPTNALVEALGRMGNNRQQALLEQQQAATE